MSNDKWILLSGNPAVNVSDLRYVLKVESSEPGIRLFWKSVEPGFSLSFHSAADRDKAHLDIMLLLGLPV